MLPCTGLMGRIFGHKFQPRFNYEPRTVTFENLIGGYGFSKALMESASRRTYLGDQCVRCGKFVPFRTAEQRDEAIKEDIRANFIASTKERKS